MARVRRPTGGFSLVEALVSTVVLGLGIVGVSGMLTYAAISQKQASSQAIARELAERAVEDLRANGYSALTQSYGTASVATPDLPRGAGVVSWQPYPDPS